MIFPSGGDKQPVLPALLLRENWCFFFRALIHRLAVRLLQEASKDYKLLQEQLGRHVWLLKETEKTLGKPFQSHKLHIWRSQYIPRGHWKCANTGSTRQCCNFGQVYLRHYARYVPKSAQLILCLNKGSETTKNGYAAWYALIFLTFWIGSRQFVVFFRFLVFLVYLGLSKTCVYVRIWWLH